jgi:Protein of unknown function (DUF4031)
VAVYVDMPIWPFGRMKMCHMTADSHEELVVMADKIGVARKWIQHPGTWEEHFDICKSKRALAVKLGAIELNTFKEAGAHIARRREAANS